jgi:hypothetical protein
VRGLAPPSHKSNDALTLTVCTTANAKLGFAKIHEIIVELLVFLRHTVDSFYDTVTKADVSLEGT